MTNPVAELVGDVISRKRGDTAVDSVRINLAGGIAGFSFLLTVNSVRNPEDDTTQLFQSVGSITVSDADGGDVEFPLTDEQADQTPGKYWYDIQMVDTASRIKTIAKNKYIFYQDITKA